MTTLPSGEYRVPAADPGSLIVDLPLDVLRESGVLWKINRDLLHPLGLTLGASQSTTDPSAVVLDVRIAPDGLWSFAEGLTRADEWQAWYTEQRAKMTAVDQRPHSRACGISQHAHGSACHPNCPTCGGRP